MSKLIVSFVYNIVAHVIMQKNQVALTEICSQVANFDGEHIIVMEGCMPSALALSYTPGYNQCVKDLPRRCHQEFKLYTVHWITALNQMMILRQLMFMTQFTILLIMLRRAYVFQNVTNLKNL